MKKIVIAIMLIVVMFCTGCSGLLQSIKNIELPKKDTPIAKIEGDDYVPYDYSNKEKEEAVTAGLKKELAAIGGDVEVYASEDEYNKAQQKKAVEAKAAAKNVTVALAEESFTPVKQTITVMSTATGSKENGNYVPSKPIANAVVRVDGVPRYTDRKGQIFVTLYKEYAELYVEKKTETENYNPYIEIMDVSNEEKVVYLKQASDDIDVYAVMFKYDLEDYNLLTQPCYILENEINSYNGMTIKCNVEADSYMLYANDKLIKYNFESTIDFIDFENYSAKDKFSIQVSYNGILSKRIGLQLYVDELNIESIRSELEGQVVAKAKAKQNAVTYGNSDSKLEYDIGNEEAGIGDVGKIGVSEATIIKALLDLILINENFSLSVGPVSINIEFIFNSRKGTIKFILGFEVGVSGSKVVEHGKYKAKTDEKATKYKNKKEKAAAIENKMIDSQEKIAEYDKQIKDSFNNTLENDQQLADLRFKKAQAEENLAKEKEAAKTSNDWREYNLSKKEFRDAKNDLTSCEKDAKKSYEEDFKKIQNAEQGNKDAYRNLINYLKNGKGLKQKVSKIKNMFSRKGDGTPSSKFGVDLDLSVVGELEISYITGKFVQGNLYGEVKITPSYTYQGFAPAGPIVIPYYIKVQLTVSGKAIFLDSNVFSFEDSFVAWVQKIQLSVGIALRIDGGVGLAGLASVGVYGKAGFEFGLQPDTYGKFDWGAGIKVQFLMFEKEWGFESHPIYFNGNEKNFNYSLMSRMTSPVERLTDNQLFGRIYQGSQPQLIPLENNRQLLIWIADDESRDDYNRTALKYSFCNNGKWSEPKNVFNDNFSDYNFSAYQSNNRIHLASQRVAKEINSGDDMDAILKSSEIYAIEFDVASLDFKNEQRITDNATLDYLPQFVVKDGEPIITWQKNSANDYFGLTGENSILSSKYVSEIWSKPNEAYVGDKIIYKYSSAISNNQLVLAICEDKDNDLATEDSVLNIVIVGEQNILTENAFNPCFINDNGNIELLYYKEGNIYISNDFAIAEVLFEGDIPRDFKVSNLNGNATIFYENSSEQVEQIFVAFKRNNNWIKNVQLSSETNEEFDIFNSIGYYDKDTVFFAYNQRNKNGEAVLCFDSKKLKTDININAYSSNSIIDKQQANIKVYVENVGDLNVSEISVLACNQQKTFICSPVLQINEGRYFDVDFIANILKCETIDITVKVMENGVELIEKIFRLQVLFTDVGMNVDAEVRNGKQCYIVNIQNFSLIEANIEFSIYLKGEKFKEFTFLLAKLQTKKIEIVFDEINLDDKIKFCIEIDVIDADISDNSAVFYSIQTEKIAIINANKYVDVLNKAKKYLEEA